MIIGITNLPCSGGDTLGKILVDRGFTWFSYSDILREELRKKGKEINRDSLRELANSLREKDGNGALSKLLLKKMKSGKDYVVATIRNPGEVIELRKTNDFVLIHLDAPRETRFKRMVSRNRENDPKTFDDFLALEKKELKDNVAQGLQIGECIKMADYKLFNDGTFRKLEKEAENLLQMLEEKGLRK